MSIDLYSYPNLSQFGILASGELTSNPTSGDIVVNSGYWDGTPVTGALTAGTSPSGLNNTISTAALTELDTLITDFGTITSSMPINNIGTGGSDITFTPGYYIGGGITFSGKTITFDALGNSNAQFFIRDTLTGFTFTNCTFIYNNNANPYNIFWFANKITGAFTATDSSVPGTIITIADFTATNDAAPAMSFNGHIFSKGAATLTRSGAGTLTITSNNGPIICYLKGTLILTNQGFVPIENIKAGHQVVTKGKIHKNKFVKVDANIKIEPVMWISKFKVFNLNSKSRPICVSKDAFGKNYPFKDLYVSPGHRFLLDGNMVVASSLVNGKTIWQDTKCDDVVYYHLECQEHSAIIANGVLTESYLDINTKDVFENSIRYRRKIPPSAPKNNFKKIIALGRY